ncbi:MAG: MATE family efflux transporter [Clostridia bacterium]|nr:MATE family efflux transporter [Clostridia bacterium]
MFTKKDIIRILLPLFAEQILAVTVGMLDTVMVSSAGEAAVSGVSLVDSINLLLNTVFTAMATGGAVVCSQFLGKKDETSARASAKQLVWCTTFIAIIIMAVALIFRTSLLKLIFGKIEKDVMFHAQRYFLFTSLSFPFMAIYGGCAAIFRSMGNSKISMYASIVMNVLNVIGNSILIYLFHLGAAGAAIATLFARIVGAVIMLYLIRNRNNVIYLERLLSYKPDFTIIKRILGIGIPSGLENSMFQFGKLLTQSLISTFGTAAIAANSVAHTLSTFEYAVGTAISLTMITVVGQCIGAENKKEAKSYTLKLMGIEYAVMIGVVVIIGLSANIIIGFYNLSEEASKLGYTLIMLHGILVATIWPVSFTLPNAFRAASDVKYPMFISVLSMWVFRVGFSYVFALSFDLGVLGVWLAMFTDWAFRAILFLVHFLRGSWLKKYKPIQKAG